MIEIFKEVTIGGLDYKISNFGNIIGEKGKIKQRLNKDGYLVVTLGSSKNNTRTSYFVHKLVALYFVNNDDTNKNVVTNNVCASVPDSKGRNIIYNNYSVQ